MCAHIARVYVCTSERSERETAEPSVLGVVVVRSVAIWYDVLSSCTLRVSTLPDKGEESLVTTLLDRERATRQPGSTLNVSES